MSDAAVSCMIAIVDALVLMYRSTQWDVPEAALRRIAIVLLVGSREMPLLVDTYRVVANVLNLNVPCECTRARLGGSVQGRLTPASDEPASTDDLLESLGLATGPMADWLDTDLSWLDSAMLLGAFDSSAMA